MFKIIKVSKTWKKGTDKGRHTAVLKIYDKDYKTEKSAKMVLTKLGWESENSTYYLPDGYINNVGWIVVNEDTYIPLQETT